MGVALEKLSPYKGDIFNLVRTGTLAQIKSASYEGACLTSLILDEPEKVPLFLALENPDPNVFKFILDEERENNRNEILNGAQKFFGMSILYWAAVKNPRPDILEILIDKSANLNEQYSDGRKILMEALRVSSNIEIIKLLAKNGIDLKAKDFNSKTAFDYAKNMNDLNDIIEFLSPDYFIQ